MTIPTADRVRRVITAQTDVENPADTAHIVNDLGVDSLGTIELTMALEDEFGVEIADEDMVNLGTVGDVIALVERLAGQA